MKENIAKNLLIEGKRGYLIDFHRNDLNEVSFVGVDFDKYRQMIKNANIDNLMIYAKDHWGWAYYPSEVGYVHPKMLEAGIDFLSEMKKIAEQEGVDVCVYYSIDTDMKAAKEHEEWIAVDPFGKKVTAGGRWYRCSIASGYGEYVLNQVKEILELYKPKGIFFDCFPSVLCFCDECKGYYHEMMGREMPDGDDVHQKWRDLQEFEEKYYWLPFINQLRNLIDTVSPGTLLTTNGCNANNPHSVRGLYDYHFAEPWAGNYLSAGFSRDVMKAAQIGPGNLGWIHDTTPVDYIKREILSIGMQGIRPFIYSESMDLDGSLAVHEWERISEVYQLVKEVEKYWDNSLPICDLQILYSERSHLYAPERKRYIHEWWDRKSLHLSGIQAVMSYAASAHIGYGIVEGDRLKYEDLDLSKLLVIPNARVLPTVSWEIIRDFVGNGGKALICLDGPIISLNGDVMKAGPWEDIIGGKLVSQNNSFSKNDINGYLKMKAELPIEFKCSHHLGIVGAFVDFEADQAEVWANFCEPAFEIDIEHEKWTAWRSPYPKNTVNGAAIIKNAYVKGQVVFAGFDILNLMAGKSAMLTGLADQGEQKWHWPRQLLKSIMTYLQKPMITLKGASDKVFSSYFMQGDHGILVHILNNELDAIYMGGSKLVIDKKLCKSLERAYSVYPEEKELTFIETDDHFEIDILPQNLYSIIFVKKEKAERL